MLKMILYIIIIIIILRQKANRADFVNSTCVLELWQRKNSFRISRFPECMEGEIEHPQIPRYVKKETTGFSWSTP